MSAYVTAAWVYTPYYRIRAAEYTSFLGSFSAAGIDEKAVAGPDEDALTMAVEAVRGLIASASVDPSRIRAMCLASTTLPYTYKHPAGTVAGAAGLPHELFTTCHTTSCRASTEALLAAVHLAEKLGACLVVAADTPAAGPTDPLEHGMGAAAAALLVEPAASGVMAIETWQSVVRESLGTWFRALGDAHLREHANPGHAEREMAAAVVPAVRNLLGRTSETDAFAAVVVNEMDARDPGRYQKLLGLAGTRVHLGPVVRLGYTGVSSGLLSLLHAAREVPRGRRLLLVSYGHGGAADAVSFVADDTARAWTGRFSPVRYLSYRDYLRYRGAL